MKILSFVILLSLSLGCSNLQGPSAPQRAIWRPALWPDGFRDQGSLESLIEAIEKHLRYWRSLERREFELAGRTYTSQQYQRALEQAHAALKRGRAPREVFAETFDLFVRAEQTPSAPLLLTAYYEPILKASRARNDKHFQPLYASPKNLVTVSLSVYERVFPDWGLWQGERPDRMRGMLTSSNEVVPFYSREQIDGRGLLQGQAEILGYVDPVDAFFLQIQGSGVLEFEDGTQQTVGYANQNGHDYYPIGRALLKLIPKQDMSLGAIQEFLRGLEPKQRYEFMSLNPSYVFFRRLRGRGETSLGTEVIDGRTLATDPRIFPRGHLSLLQFSVQGLPIESKSGRISRFVVHQDTGGAIKGPLRADLFWGRGAEAEAVAGKVKQPGQIFLLVPKAL